MGWILRVGICFTPPIVTCLFPFLTSQRTYERMLLIYLTAGMGFGQVKSARKMKNFRGIVGEKGPRGTGGEGEN